MLALDQTVYRTAHSRMSPMNTGTTSLTSTVNRNALRASPSTFAGLKKYSTTSQQSLSSRQIGLLLHLDLIELKSQRGGLARIRPCWKAFVATAVIARSRGSSPRLRTSRYTRWRKLVMPSSLRRECLPLRLCCLSHRAVSSVAALSTSAPIVQFEHSAIGRGRPRRPYVPVRSVCVPTTYPGTETRSARTFGSTCSVRNCRSSS